MKLEKYVDKNAKRRKTILITISAIVLISVSLLLYKTFASFTESAEFPIMNGKVDYFGNSDIYFVFYQGDKELEEMPQKDNKENLVFDYGECDNGATIEWNEEEWGPMVKNLSNSKTKCSLYFKVQKEIVLGKDILPVESGDGLYAVPHNDLIELDSEWNKTEYRYAGANPDNYVSFNNEIWRVIGLVNVKTNSGVEQRIKIIRTDGIEWQKNFGYYSWDSSNIMTNNWTEATLKDMLNGIYYEAGIGDCFRERMTPYQCDFTGNGDEPKGLDDIARNMIDKEVIWNIGSSSTYHDLTVGMFYERERGTRTYGNYNPAEWSSATDEGEKHNGIGLIYPSDYGYATSDGSIGRETCFVKELYGWDSEDGNYKSECVGKNWLKPNNEYLWTLTSFGAIQAFDITYDGYVEPGDEIGSVYTNGEVCPTLYLTTSTKIVDGNGNINSPFVLSIQ